MAAELYFAYGSNMSGARLHARIEGARALDVGILQDHALVFDKPGRDGTAKANVRRRPGAVVHGVVWEIEVGALAVLDRFEPGYGRHPLEISLADTTLASVWTYVYAPDGVAQSPSPEYVRHLIDGALEHGLPGDLVTHLEAFAPPR